MSKTTNSIEQLLESYPMMLTVDQMSEILNCSRDTGYRKVHSGQLKFLKLGRDIRIPKNEIIKYIINNLVKS